MTKSINIKTVMIKNISLPENKNKIELSEVNMEQEMKKQNRGTVILVGGEVTWPEVGMNVSYLRNAATPFVDDDGTEYQIVNKAHILAEFETVKTKK